MLVEILVPLGICVVLPVLIVWFVTRVRINSDNKRTQIIIEAIKANNSIDTDKLAAALSKPKKSTWDKLTFRFQWGTIFTLIGIAFIVISIIFYFTQIIGGEEFLGYLTIAVICISFGVGFLLSFVIGKRLLRNPEKERER